MERKDSSSTSQLHHLSSESINKIRDALQEAQKEHTESHVTTIDEMRELLCEAQNERKEMQANLRAQIQAAARADERSKMVNELLQARFEARAARLEAEGYIAALIFAVIIIGHLYLVS